MGSFGVLVTFLFIAFAAPAYAAGLVCPETGKGAVSVSLSASQARLLTAAGDVDLSNEIEELIVRLKNEHPHISYGSMTNALIAAYCPIIAEAPSLSAQEKLNHIKKFEVLLRERLSSDIPPGSWVQATVPLEPGVYRALRDKADRSGQTPSKLMADLLSKGAGEGPEK